MLTPQDLQEISFEKAVFGGYDMGAVDDFIEPLTEDYVTLYKENSVLKSKMRILVEKLEEYRRQETSMQTALMTTQKTCDQMVAETEKKCARLLREAEENASKKAQNADAQIGTEKERLEEAKLASAKFIDGMEKRLQRQIELLQELRTASELPLVEKPAQNRAYDFDKEQAAPTAAEKADALIDEIGKNVEESCAENTASEPAPAQGEKPGFHGELPPAKQRLLNELQFGQPTKE